MTYGSKVYRKQGGSGLVVATGGYIDNRGAVDDASITVGAESTNVRAITIQLKKGDGTDIAERQVVHVFVLADANGDAIVGTGGSTGIAIGTDGAILATLTAKKAFIVVSEADGDIDLTWTDTGTEVAYLGVLLPSGKLVISSALTNT
jgi:hypothetical protein